jgi:hypothetical protein
MDDELFAKGHNGQIRIAGDWLTIERKGLGRIGHSKGDRRIPLGTITAVQVRPAGALANGFIRFSVPGSVAARGGLTNASQDENAVIFTKKQTDDFDAVRRRVEDYITRRSAPASVTAAPDIPSQLKQLADLRDAGVLTDAEFDSKKKDLLDRM